MTTENKQVYLVSDSSGRTGQRITKAALSQFDTDKIDLRIFSLVRANETIERIVKEAKENKAIILFTMVEDSGREKMFELSKALNVEVIDLLGGIIEKLHRHLDAEPKRVPGLFKGLPGDEEPPSPSGKQ